VTAVQYRIAILLLFFAISTVSSLLFLNHNDQSATSFGGNIGFFTFAVGGPAALWLIALVVFTYFYPESRLEPAAPHTLPMLARLIDDIEGRSGWYNYTEWKGQWNEFSTVLGTGESATVKNLLWYTYFQIQGPKLSNAEITTAFFYFKSFTLKIQRIQGDKNGDTFRLLFSAGTSLSGSENGSFAFVGRDSGTIRILKTESDRGARAAREIELTDKRVDCLLLSYYVGDNPNEGDYIVVDLKRYSDNASGHIRLGIVDFERPIHAFHLSTLKRRNIAFEDIPLSFHSETVSVSKVIAPVETNLRPWLSALDNFLKNGAGAAVSDDLFANIVKTKKTLEGNLFKAGILKSAEDISFSQLMNLATHSKSRHFLDLPRAQQIVLTMFRY
jgi:hypothetical protein